MTAMPEVKPVTAGKADVFAHRFEADRLMVIVTDRLSDLVRKGEITARYYNPGELFREVHLVMVNDDKVDPAAVQPTVGSARLVLHNIPAGKKLFATSLAWRPWLLRRWAAAAIDLAARVKPNLVRCHGAHLNAFAARAIKRELGIPYVVSLHTQPDQSVRSGLGGRKEALFGYLSAAMETVSLRDADLVIAVYRAIVPFLRRIGVQKFRVAYNVVTPGNAVAKRDYRSGARLRIVCVGRQIPGKEPDNIIRAVARNPNMTLLVVGDGPRHDFLRRLTEDLGAGGRVEFRTNIANDALCRMLPEFDVFAAHSDYHGLPKTVMEAMLLGLPAVLNRGHCGYEPELTEDACALVEDTADGYAEAFRRLAEDTSYRERLGRAGFAHARAHWAPEKAEAAFVGIYRDLLAQSGQHAT